MSSLIASWSASSLSIKILTSVCILIATFFVIKKVLGDQFRCSSKQVFLRSKFCTEKKDLTGKVIVITGGNTGIGYETAKALAGMGGSVIIACRDAKKANSAITRLKSANSNLKVETLPLDLSSFESIKKFVSDFSQKYDKLDILINNAGIMAVPKGKTKEGYELQFGTNHVGHFLLTRLLLPYIKKGQKSRIINVSSDFHRTATPGFFHGGNYVVDLDDITGDKRYYKWSRYAKVCNILFTLELAKRLQGTGIEVFALHPGIGLYYRVSLAYPAVATDIYVNVASTVESLGTYLFNCLFAKSSEEGAQTSIWAAVSSKLDGKSGAYLAECGFSKPTSYASDPALASKLWTLSCQLTGLPENI